MSTMDSLNGTAQPMMAPTTSGNTSSNAIGFSGSGWLIFYFTGVTTVLKQLGIINNTTRLAGASGGAINAVLACADVPAAQQYADLVRMAATCRAAPPSCRGFLDKSVTTFLSPVIPANVTQLCGDRLWLSITGAQPEGQPDKNVLLGGNWTSRAEALAAARLSAFLPGLSSPSGTLRVPELPAVGAAYDGGFSQNLPCPPGVPSCIKVSAVQLELTGASDQNLAGFIATFNAAASSSQGKVLAQADPATGPFLPLTPVVTPTPKPDIWPGLAQPLPINGTVWSSWSLSVPDDAALKTMYDTGRQDAAFWASREGLASAAAATNALQVTAV